MTTVVWNGTIMEELDLIAAIQHNCDCKFGRRNVRLSACAGHSMLAGDQRALNGLLWTRHLAKRLLAEEGICRP